jgi:hypothetical protein
MSFETFYYKRIAEDSQANDSTILASIIYETASDLRIEIDHKHQHVLKN